MESESSTNDNFNVLLRLQRQLRQLDRKVLSPDSSVQTWLQKQKQQLFKQQSSYNNQMDQMKNGIDISLPSIPQLPPNVLRNMTDNCQLQLDRILSRGSHLYSHLKKRIQKQRQGCGDRVQRVNDDINCQLSEQKKQIELEIGDLAQEQQRTLEESIQMEGRRQELCRKLSGKMERLEKELYEKISLMSEQNYDLTEKLEAASRDVQQEIQKQKQLTNKEFRKHYQRLEHCIKNLVEPQNM